MGFLSVLLQTVALFAVVDQLSEAETVCPSQLVEATYSEDALLLCRLEPPTDATHQKVEWRRGKEVVHLYQGGQDEPAEQSVTFKGRTSLSSEELSKGNLSLKLSSLLLTDSGRYQCSFITESLDQSCFLNLSVGESDVFGSPEPITAFLGHDVVLPCHLEPPFDLTTLTVEWKYRNTMVHVYRSQGDDSDSQDPKFKGRTSLFHDEMVHGNISLRLTNVTKEDSGNYSCFIPKLHSQVRRGNITLNVADPVNRDVKEDRGSSGSEPEPGSHELHLGLAVGLGVAAAVAVAVGVVAIYKHRGGQPIREEVQQEEPVILEEREEEGGANDPENRPVPDQGQNQGDPEHGSEDSDGVGGASNPENIRLLNQSQTQNAPAEDGPEDEEDEEEEEEEEEESCINSHS